MWTGLCQLAWEHPVGHEARPVSIAGGGLCGSGAHLRRGSGASTQCQHRCRLQRPHACLNGSRSPFRRQDARGASGSVQEPDPAFPVQPHPVPHAAADPRPHGQAVVPGGPCLCPCGELGRLRAESLSARTRDGLLSRAHCVWGPRGGWAAVSMTTVPLRGDALGGIYPPAARAQQGAVPCRSDCRQTARDGIPTGSSSHSTEKWSYLRRGERAAQLPRPTCTADARKLSGAHRTGLEMLPQGWLLPRAVSHPEALPRLAAQCRHPDILVSSLTALGRASSCLPLCPPHHKARPVARTWPGARVHLQFTFQIG